MLVALLLRADGLHASRVAPPLRLWTVTSNSSIPSEACQCKRIALSYAAGCRSVSNLRRISAVCSRRKTRFRRTSLPWAVLSTSRERSVSSIRLVIRAFRLVSSVCIAVNSVWEKNVGASDSVVNSTTRHIGQVPWVGAERL
jgi:hypothetical protein